MRLDYGLQPLCNRYLAHQREEQALFPLVLVQDAATGLVRIETPIPADAMRPRVPWLSETEPSSHLDEIAASLAEALGQDRQARIIALGYRDRPLAERLRGLGFANLLEIPKERLGLADPLAKVESVQAALSDPAVTAAIAGDYGNADLVLGVRILHHAHDARAFLAGVRSLLAPGGKVLFEVPDCRNHLVSHDHTMVFEEHTLYFTPATLGGLLRAEGFGVARQTLHPMAIEDSLSVLAVASPGEPVIEPALLAREKALFQDFAAGFSAARDQIRAFLRGLGGKIAVFGAGHHGIAFVNLYGLGDLVSAFIDDNQHKLQVRVPGSALPVWPSSRLAEDGIGHCLLAVSQENERKIFEVVGRKSPATARHSIFVESPLAMAPYRMPSWPGSPRPIATGY